MAIKPAFAVAAAALASLAISAPAQADLQTWRLTATSYQVESGFDAPAFAELSKTFTVDYVFDTLTPSLDTWPGTFDGAVKSFTINGDRSQAGGYIVTLGGDGFSVINVMPSKKRSDGINFISFNHPDGVASADVASALKDFAAKTAMGRTELRLDFGAYSIYASPTSFVMTSVPEPSAAWLLLAGVPLLAIQQRGRRSAAA
ncbi:hypothetical protein [Aquabacterium parvum]|uniref:hypothetical protein n=1 Tax=Aquabacterium parvum TaxID=70584 RepID=UPI000718E7AD|nr:hypothetical protein [Aquabacterium parvum]MBU0915415.1 hypothetical protein [Gammaproteobacteria bacterium]